MIKQWFRIAACAALVVAVAQGAEAQRKKKAPDPSQGAVASQTIGVDTEITITYHRPGVKGRDVWKDQSAFAQIGPLVDEQLLELVDDEEQPLAVGRRRALPGFDLLRRAGVRPELVLGRRRQRIGRAGDAYLPPRPEERLLVRPAL